MGLQQSWVTLCLLRLTAMYSALSFAGAVGPVQSAQAASRTNNARKATTDMIQQVAMALQQQQPI